MPLNRISGHFDADDAKCDAVRNDIVKAMMGIDGLGITVEKGITCLFYPTKMMESDLESTIIIEVIGLFVKLERTDEIRKQLADKLGQVIRDHFPETNLVQCFVRPFDLAEGFSESRKKLVVPGGEEALA